MPGENGSKKEELTITGEMLVELRRNLLAREYKIGYKSLGGGCRVYDDQSKKTVTVPNGVKKILELMDMYYFNQFDDVQQRQTSPQPLQGDSAKNFIIALKAILKEKADERPGFLKKRDQSTQTLYKDWSDKVATLQTQAEVATVPTVFAKRPGQPT